MTQTANSDTWSAERYTSVANFVFSAKYTSAVLELLAPKQGDRIVDFGCGSGEVTKQLEAIVGDGGLVVGYDASGNMVSRIAPHTVQRALTHASHSHPSRSTKLARTASRTPTSPTSRSPSSTRARTAAQARSPRGPSTRSSRTRRCTGASATPAAVVRNAHALLRPGGTFAAEFGGFTNCIGASRRRRRGPRTSAGKLRLTATLDRGPLGAARRAPRARARPRAARPVVLPERRGVPQGVHIARMRGKLETELKLN